MDSRTQNDWPSVACITYRRFIIKQIWKGTATNVETGEVRDDNTFSYCDDEGQGGYGSSVDDCKSQIDDYYDGSEE